MIKPLSDFFKSQMIGSQQRTSLKVAVLMLAVPFVSMTSPNSWAQDLRDNVYKKLPSMVDETRTIEMNRLPEVDPLLQFSPQAYFGTSEIKRTGKNQVQCNRCNENRVTSFIDVVLNPKPHKCEQSYFIADDTTLATVEARKRGAEGFFYRHAYQCQTSPLPLYLEQRMVPAAGSVHFGKQVGPSNTCGIRFRGGNIIVMVDQQEAEYAFGHDVKIEFKEYLESKAFDPNEEPVLRVKPFSGLVNSHKFSQVDTRVAFKTTPHNNNGPHLASISLTRAKQYESLSIQFEQGAPVQLTALNRRTGSKLLCALTVGYNGFAGKFQVSRN